MDERLIQSVKRCLRKSLGRTILNFDQMNTLLVEIEGILNLRPLTCVEDNTRVLGTHCHLHTLYKEGELPVILTPPTSRLLERTNL